MTEPQACPDPAVYERLGRLAHLEFRVDAVERDAKKQEARIERLIRSNERMAGAVKVVGFLLTLASVVIQLLK